LGSVNEFEVPRLDPWFGFLADTGVTSLFAWKYNAKVTSVYHICFSENEVDLCNWFIFTLCSLHLLKITHSNLTTKGKKSVMFVLLFQMSMTWHTAASFQCKYPGTRNLSPSFALSKAPLLW
jgi:hypothetical protein